MSLTPLSSTAHGDAVSGRRFVDDGVPEAVLGRVVFVTSGRERAIAQSEIEQREVETLTEMESKLDRARKDIDRRRWC